MPWFRRATSDAAVVQRVRAGKRDEFGALVDRYLPVAYAVCYAQLHNAADAEDAAQDAFVKAYEALDGLKEPTKFGPWLLSIVRNICRNHKRSRAREAERVDALAILGQPPSTKPEDVEIRNVVRQQVDGLDDIHREVLLLHYYGGRSIKDIAALLELSQDAVKKRLQRAREALSGQMLKHLEPAVAPARKHRDGVKAIMGLLAGATAAWEASAAAGVGAAGVAGGIALGTLAKAIAGAAAVLAVTGAVVYWQVPPDPPAPAVAQATPIAQNATADTAPAQTTPSARSDPSNSSSAPPAVPQSGYFIRGRTVDQAGNPVPHATLTVDPYEKNRGKHHETESDESGWYLFPGVDATSYIVQAMAPGLYGTDQFSGTSYQVPESQAQTYDITMFPAGALGGVLRSKTGEPVPGALVTPWPASPMGKARDLSLRWRELRSIRTGNDGRFQLDPLYAEKWGLEVDSPVHVFCETQAFALNESPVTITLTPGAHVEGRVVYAGTETPVPDVTVSTRERRSAVTGADGSFVLQGVRGGDKIAIEVEHDTLISLSKDFMVPEGGDVTGVKVEVAQGGIITGRVYDAQTGEGISPAWIDIKLDGGGSASGDSNDGENGKYEITRLQPGTYHVRGVRGGRGYLESRNPVHDPLRVELGQTITGIDFGLTKGATIRGTVHAPADATINHLMIRVLYTDEANEPYRGRSQVIGIGEAGDFAISGFPPGEPVTISASATGWASETVGPLTLGPDGIDGVSLTLGSQPVASIHGRVVYGAGVPLAEAGVSITGSTSGYSTTAFTGDDGTFALENLVADEYTMMVHGRITNPEPIPPIVVAPGQTMTDLVIDLGGGSGMIAGHVIDDTGVPVKGANIYAPSGGPQVPGVTSDEKGAFTLQGLEPGPHRVRVQAEGYAAGELEDVATGTHNVRMVIDRAGSVEGRAIDGRTDRPLTEFEVMVQEPELLEHVTNVNLPYKRYVNDSGVFRIDNLPPGAYTVMVRAAGLFPDSAEIAVAAGQVVAVPDLVLEPGAIVNATVVNERGQPLDGAQVYANSRPNSPLESRPDEKSVQTGADGKCTFEQLVPGSNLIYVNHPDYAPSEYTLDIQAGVTLSPTFTLSESGVIEGVVTAGGRAVPDTRVDLRFTDAALSAFKHFHTDTKTDEHGAYRFEGLFAGQVTVHVRLEALVLERSIDIMPGQTSRADLDLGAGGAVVSGLVRAPFGTFDGAEMRVVLGTETPSGQVKYYSEVDGDGRFVLSNVVAGQAQLKVTGASAGHAQITKLATLTVPPTGEITHDFDFGQGATVQGKVTIRSDAPRVFVLLFAGQIDLDTVNIDRLESKLGMRVIGETLLDQSGPFQFDAVDPGDYTLLAVAAERGHVSGTHVTVPEGESVVNVDLALP
ncbi:MAG: sigma-70 family RNA polymerase sigma factor [Candidatus Hydrogenedentes bacterium]|nr:sigma-70 family RNA polymerase sigma factor [Candidatus Hydrogenedentota bacterium]